MAEGKRNTVKRKTTNTSSSQSSASRKRSSTSKATGRNTGVRRTSQAKNNEIDSELKEEIILFLLFALFVFILLCMIGVIKGVLGEMVKQLMLGLFGLLGYLVPLALLAGFLIKISNKNNTIATIKLISGVVLAFIAGIIICLVSGFNVSNMAESSSLLKDLYDSQEKGGIIFGLCAVGLYKLLGIAGSWFVCVILGLIAIALITETSILKKIITGQNIFDIDFPQHDYYEEDDNVALIEDNRARIAENKRQKYEERIQKERERELEHARLIEEKKQAAIEKERQRDLKDDQRILNTTIKAPSNAISIDNISGTIPLLEGPNKRSKHEIHEITLTNINISDEMLDIKNQSEVNESLDSNNQANVDEIFSSKTQSDSNNDVEQAIESDSQEIDFELEKKIIQNAEPEFEIKSIDEKVKLDSDTKEIKPIKDEVNSSVSEVFTPVSEAVSPLPEAVSSVPEPITELSHKENEKPEAKAKPINKNYIFPSLDLLKLNKALNKAQNTAELKETAQKLEKTLETFGVGVEAIEENGICKGPSVTRYELRLKPGVKVNKILNLQDDIKLSLAAQDIRIEAPIPGKSAVGIEIPNKDTTPVLIRDLLDTKAFDESESKITFAVGKDISGKTIVADIAKMPHMLIAGSTGSGKSVCINTLIMSIIYKADPKDVKLIMIDPKVVELSVYNGIPHLLLPVVTDPRKASAALHWAVTEMDKRYKAFAEHGVRDLKGYNQKNKDKQKPQIVVIVDELADLMMVASKEVEESICRLAQLARAAGIHLIIATQRPSVDVITGLIKANMPSRVAFKVSSGTDSRTILDSNGAEKLLGKGDMLFSPQGYSKPLRVQGAFVSDDEVNNVVEFLKANAGDNVYDEEIEAQISNITSDGSSSSSNIASGDASNNLDQYFAEACRLVIEREKASSGMLQRVYKIGFNRAARIIDQMESYGVVGPEEGTKPRKVLMSISELEDLLESI